MVFMDIRIPQINRVIDLTLINAYDDGNGLAPFLKACY
ncbi:hypothetical protein D1AOALGA4SA_3747 [Olavius algarvensis Delta 1 endosymbiont]|nr:hypothetical protein D1AOALGA4SA_3747 [Olavius algarvensis Delta 1 endosymbiont]